MSDCPKASLLSIFTTFFKIGAFTFGGAYAMIPLIRKELVQKHKWMTDEDFLDGLATAQSCPGPIAVNISVYLGVRLRMVPGLITAVLGTVLPSFITIVVIAMFFGRISDLEATQRVFHALRPAVVALIALPVIQMSRAGGVNIRNVWVPILAAILVGLVNFSPIYLILLAVVYSILSSYFPVKRRDPQ